MAEFITQNIDCPKLRCLIVDDETIAVQGIQNCMSKMNSLEFVGSCSSAIEAARVLKEKDIDLLFLDINMPYLNGLEFLESLDKAPLTIITTAYSEYALDGFRLNVVDYLLKPYSFQRFFQATQKAMEIFQSQVLLQENNSEKSTDMYIRQGESFQRINWKDILYVESIQNYLKLHFKDKSFVIHQTMSSLENLLPKEEFFRIHKSYLVNNAHIDLISGGRIFVGGIELPISRLKKEGLLNTVVYKKLMSK